MDTVQQPSRSTDPSAVGALCWAGDVACESSDLAALGGIARRLVELVPEPLHCELVAFADRCAEDPAHAVAAWTALRDRVLGLTGAARP